MPPDKNARNPYKKSEGIECYRKIDSQEVFSTSQEIENCSYRKEVERMI